MAHTGKAKRPTPVQVADKRPLYVELTTDAYDGWVKFCGVQGCTVTSLVEALGQALHTDAEPFLELAEFDPRFGGIVVAARAITAERRRRKP